MKSEENINIILKRLEQKKRTRILAFGASDTQRRSYGMHWLDCLELGLNQKFGPYVTMINTGIGGDTAKMLLKRFDQDAAFYKPHLVIITIGGNDAVGGKNITPEQFAEDLKKLYRKFSKLGTLVVFQTYYAFNNKKLKVKGCRRFNEFMQIVRKIAAKTGASLIDHHKRWMSLQEKEPDLYYSLMLDTWHLNDKGNLVMGSDIAHNFKADALFKANEHMDESALWKDSLKTIKLMDSWEIKENE